MHSKHPPLLYTYTEAISPALLIQEKIVSSAEGSYKVKTPGFQTKPRVKVAL